MKDLACERNRPLIRRPDPSLTLRMPESEPRTTLSDPCQSFRRRELRGELALGDLEALQSDPLVLDEEHGLEGLAVG